MDKQLQKDFLNIAPAEYMITKSLFNINFGGCYNATFKEKFEVQNM